MPLIWTFRRFNNDLNGWDPLQILILYVYVLTTSLIYFYCCSCKQNVAHLSVYTVQLYILYNRCSLLLSFSFQVHRLFLFPRARYNCSSFVGMILLGEFQAVEELQMWVTSVSGKKKLSEPWAPKLAPPTSSCSFRPKGSIQGWLTAAWACCGEQLSLSWLWLQWVFHTTAV